ncbi:type II toxin-antitoxin system HicA family toxin [Kovacikia minuta CCNUW1]|uniref:type II toxin-antitoxin system HicA family toxin n=1 Tax=Kovacikia minuta TaxID=2931930 RepID=UPI001CCC4F19|nr:type II toxin-antitoxin system HicA family toxin [Kovacikia minuta]UBF24532.1 type II toxin-antitoxin system HicA family toxin [Kovacikia minuta CCNUW1]
MTHEITFADIEKLFLKLGFAPSNTAGTQQVFRHSALGTLIVLPDYDHQESIRPIHLTTIRKILVENGLMTPAAFDGFLEKVPG